MVGDRRRRKSQWDVDDDTSRHFSGMNERSSWAGREHQFSHDSGHYHEFSESRSFVPSKSRYDAGHPYWEREFQDSGFDGGSRYFQNMSPGFDGMDRHKYDSSRETSRGHSHSYAERRRSRSRSRSRTRGRSRSRSLSRGRNRERDKVWNRSRSRSRGHGNVKDQLKNVPDNLSRLCRDFASGRCRQGSECRFYHLSGASRGDGEPSQDDTRSSWTNKADGGHIPHPRNDGSGPDLDSSFSDPSRGREERFQTRSGRSIPCREFLKGSCRWGDACRFLHDFASGDKFDEAPRHAPSATENEHQEFKIEKPLCKFFAMGKCGRNNCRFSHEDPKIFSLDGTLDAAKEDRKNDILSVHGLDNDNKISGVSEWTNNSFHQQKQPASLGRASSIGEGIGAAEHIIANNVDTPGLYIRLQSQDANRKDKVQDTLQGSTFAVEDWKGNKNTSSGIQLEEYQREVLDEAKEFQTSNHSVILPWQNQNQDLGNLLAQNSSRVQIAGILAANVPHPFPNMLNNELGTQFVNAPAAIAGHDISSMANPSGLSVQRIENEVSQKNAELDTSPRMFGMVSSVVNSNNEKSSPVIVSYSLIANGNPTEQNNQMQNLQATSFPVTGPNSIVGLPKLEHLKEAEINGASLKEAEGVSEMKHPEGDGLGTVEESISSKDDKSIRLFKNSLVELVKEILKPTWKEGQMSREVHKSIVKKVVDKVTTTIQTDHIPKTRDKVDQYLKYSKTKISKLVQAYVGRALKKDS